MYKVFSDRYFKPKTHWSKRALVRYGGTALFSTYQASYHLVYKVITQCLRTMSIASSMVKIKGLRASIHLIWRRHSKRSSTPFHSASPFTLLCPSYSNYDEKEGLTNMPMPFPSFPACGCGLSKQQVDYLFAIRLPKCSKGYDRLY